eukprot:6884688-Heterocapsa_arctica.AAC.1
MVSSERYFRRHDLRAFGSRMNTHHVSWAGLGGNGSLGANCHSMVMTGRKYPGKHIVCVAIR